MMLGATCIACGRALNTAGKCPHCSGFTFDALIGRCAICGKSLTAGHQCTFAPGNTTAIDHNFKRDQEIESLRARLDALIAAARKVTCWECNDSGRMVNGLYTIPGEPDFIPCPYCAPIRDLRALLERGQ